MKVTIVVKVKGRGIKTSTTTTVCDLPPAAVKMLEADGEAGLTLNTDVIVEKSDFENEQGNAERSYAPDFPHDGVKC